VRDRKVKKRGGGKVRNPRGEKRKVSIHKNVQEIDEEDGAKSSCGAGDRVISQNLQQGERE